MATTYKRLAEMRLDHEWPAELQALWHAARRLAEAEDTPDALGSRYRAEASRLDQVYARECAEATATALRRVEALAEPLLREREG